MTSNPSKLDINERLYYYVDKRDLKNISKLLTEGAKATLVTSYGRSAVGQAAFKGYPEILIVLLKSCNEEPSSYRGGSPKKPRTEEVSESTPDGMDGLQWDDEIQPSAHSGDDEWSKLYMYYARMIEQTGELLANSIAPQDPHCLDAYHQAPIHYAAVLGHVECLHILLENGSPVDITTHNGITPLHLAVKSFEIVHMLLEHRGDPNRKTYNTGESALHVAARMGDVQVVELLLNAGADINATNNIERTPLMTAVSYNNIEIAYYLISKGAKLNVQDQEGYTALYFAVTKNNISLASFLLQRGARLFVTHYLLHFCVRNNYPEMAKLLVEAGENVNVRDFTSCSPLYLAVKKCNSNMIDFLLKNGAQRLGLDYNVRELHIAIQYAENYEQFAKVANILLAHGCDLDEYNYWMIWPALLATMLEKYKMTEFLIKEGADVNKGRTDNFMDVFTEARKMNQLNLLMLIVNAGYRLNPFPENVKSPPFKDIDNNIEDWLGHTCRNPLTLQQLSRIAIRECLVVNLKSKSLTIQSGQSKLLTLIESLGLPKRLEQYLYEFYDLPDIR